MDDHELPSAEDLGVSPEEYARILRDLRERGLGGEQVAIAAELAGAVVPDTPAGLFDTPAADPHAQPIALPTLRNRRRWAAALIAALVIGLIGWQGTSTNSGSAHDYTFLREVGGQPVTFSSCKQVRVAVYPANGPTDAVKLVEDAIATLRSATGLDIVLAGAFGGHAPHWNFESAPFTPDDPVAISWQDPAAIPRLSGDTVGLGGSVILDGRGGTQHRAAGTIALDREAYARLAARGAHDLELAILLHEFGHVLGLGHAKSPDEIMFGRAGALRLGAGDLEGLRRVGHGPCV